MIPNNLPKSKLSWDNESWNYIRTEYAELFRMYEDLDHYFDHIIPGEYIENVYGTDNEGKDYQAEKALDLLNNLERAMNDMWDFMEAHEKLNGTQRAWDEGLGSKELI
jgi:hypothetical protein